MSSFTEDDYKKIIQRRDPRYDGRFFFGVKTTKIYCRPICPAKPLAKNMVIFRSPTEAEQQGYRPCLRCHPEAAPESLILQGSANTVSRALKIMNTITDQSFSIPELADRLGVTDRHLRRLFDEHLGASPIEILNSKRLHFAKQLICETSRSMAEIALASGFQSIRRFNESFKELYKRNPTEFRKKEKSAAENATLQLTIPVKAPYDWAHVLKYLKRHECYGVEQVTEKSYRRFIPSEKGFGQVFVQYSARLSALQVQLEDIEIKDIKNIIQSLKYLFDVDHDPLHLSSGRGVRVPRSFSSFEVAISIILSQLVSTQQAKESLKKLVLHHGKKWGRFQNQDVFAFPKPEKLAKASLKDVGLTQTKIHAIHEISRLVATKEIEISPSADLALMREKLLAIKGVGPWTVEMIAMRGLGDADAFPEKDLIILRAIEAKLVDPQKWISQRAYLTHLVWSKYSEQLTKNRRSSVKHGARS